MQGFGPSTWLIGGDAGEFDPDSPISPVLIDLDTKDLHFMFPEEDLRAPIREDVGMQLASPGPQRNQQQGRQQPAQQALQTDQVSWTQATAQFAGPAAQPNPSSASATTADQIDHPVFDLRPPAQRAALSATDFSAGAKVLTPQAASMFGDEPQLLHYVSSLPSEATEALFKEWAVKLTGHIR